MTQAHLAGVWPKVDGSEGVNTRYVQDIEHGRKQVGDQGVLRKLAQVLDIPLWKVGLSEYDPFTQMVLPGHGKTMYDETLDTVEELVRQIWSLRCAARIPEADKGVKRLGKLFAYFTGSLPPPVRLEKRYLFLYVQYLRLKATALLEKKQYKEVMQVYQEIFSLVKDEEEPAVKALALKSIGKELSREGNHQEAVFYLEDARDTAMDGSKLLRAFVQSYLIRCYGGNGDVVRFERAVQTGLHIAQSLPRAYEDGTDFVYSWSPVSSILAEKSWGYLNIQQPQQTLAMKKEIEQAILMGQDARLHAWIPLDWARAYLMLGEVEAGIDAAREFYTRVTAMRSPHAINQTFKYIDELKVSGYGDVQVVKDFQAELRAAQH
jgi:tetratricopeptide (TPR) repeat protein